MFWPSGSLAVARTAAQPGSKFNGFEGWRVTENFGRQQMEERMCGGERAALICSGWEERALERKDKRRKLKAKLMTRTLIFLAREI